MLLSLPLATTSNPVIKAFLAGTVFLQFCLVALAVIALLALVWRPARVLLTDLRSLLHGKEMWVAWILAVAATAGSLYFSETLHFIPCRLCWFQRIAMYPLSVLLLVAVLRKDVRAAVQYTFMLPVFGAIVSLYHIYIEENPGAEAASCKVGVACSVKWIDELGYITIPLLALTIFLSILALLAFAWSRREPVAALPAVAEDPFFPGAHSVGDDGDDDYASGEDDGEEDDDAGVTNEEDTASETGAGDAKTSPEPPSV